MPLHIEGVETTADFVTWIDGTMRRSLRLQLFGRTRWMSELDFGEIWNACLIKVYERGLLPSDFETEKNVHHWCYSRAWFYFLNMLNGVKAVGMSRAFKASERSISQMYDDAVDERFRRVYAGRSFRSRPPSIGPSKQWFTQLMDELTERERTALVMFYGEDITGPEFYEMYGHEFGGSRQAAISAKDTAMRKTRRLIDEGKVIIAA